MADKQTPQGPNHSTRSTNTKMPGIIRPGPTPVGAPKVKITQAPTPAAPTKPAN